MLEQLRHKVTHGYYDITPLVKLVKMKNPRAITYLAAKELSGSYGNETYNFQDINIDIFSRLIPILIPFIGPAHANTIFLNKTIDLFTRKPDRALLDATDLKDQIMQRHEDNAAGKGDTAIVISPIKPFYVPLDGHAKFKNAEITRERVIILCDWLYEIQHNRSPNLPYKNLLVAIYILRILLDKIHIDRKRLQLYGICCLTLCSRINSKRILAAREAVWVTKNAYTYQEAKQVMCEIIAIVPPIVNIVIPGVDKYLDGNPSMSELGHVAMFSATEPVFDPKGFNVDAVLKQPRSYFNTKYRQDVYERSLGTIGNRLVPYAVDLPEDSHTLIDSFDGGCSYEVNDDVRYRLACGNSNLEPGRPRDVKVYRNKKLALSGTHWTVPNFDTCRLNYIPYCPTFDEEPDEARNLDSRVVVNPVYGLDVSVFADIKPYSVYKLFSHVLSGIIHLNKQSIYHTNVSPSNIAIDDTMWYHYGREPHNVEHALMTKTSYLIKLMGWEHAIKLDGSGQVPKFARNNGYQPFEVNLIDATLEEAIESYSKWRASLRGLLTGAEKAIRQRGSKGLQVVINDMTDFKSWERTLRYLKRRPSKELYTYIDLWGFAVTLLELMIRYTTYNFCRGQLITDVPVPTWDDISKLVSKYRLIRQTDDQPPPPKDTMNLPDGEIVPQNHLALRNIFQACYTGIYRRLIADGIVDPYKQDTPVTWRSEELSLDLKNHTISIDKEKYELTSYLCAIKPIIG